MHLRWTLIAIALAVGCGRLGFDSGEASDAAVDPPIDAEVEINLMFTLGAAIVELGVDEFESDDPAMTGDATELYFASSRLGGLGGADIYRALRAGPSEAWQAPQNVAALNTTRSETTIAISRSGLFIAFASNVENTVFDVFLASRANRSDDFGPPVRVTEINSSGNDSASWISEDGLSIWIHSDRDGEARVGYDIFRSARADLSSPFDPPTPIVALSNPDVAEISASFHGNFALLSINDGSGHDLFLAPRIGETMTFEEPVALVGPNTASLETDPWLSPDGCTLFFARRVDGKEQLFEASCSDK